MFEEVIGAITTVIEVDRSRLRSTMADPGLARLSVK
jgi:hypothetical protein